MILKAGRKEMLVSLYPTSTHRVIRLRLKTALPKEHDKSYSALYLHLRSTHWIAIEGDSEPVSRKMQCI